jgi:hypothetical protein
MSEQANATPSSTTTYRGGCHCAAVRFEAELDLSRGVSACNCSICVKRNAAGAMVKPDAFRLLSGEDCLSGYAWGAKVSHYYFCNRCGIQLFGRGHLAELGGDYVAVNVRCLDGIDPALLVHHHWDGRHNNWQAGPRSTPWPVAP